MNPQRIRKALVVGISYYTDYSLEKLDFCKTDGIEIYELLRTLGYQISDENKLVGEVKGEKVKNAIYDFFDDNRNNLDDILLFYYSGHGVSDVDGDLYLASSDIDTSKPYRRGSSFEELTKMIQKSISTVVVILDCCYSGSAKLSKGNEEDAAKIGNTSIDEKSRKLPQGQGKYILSASQAAQQAYALTTGEHSIFTYYLLQGLRGNTESVDNEGNVTPQSLGKYVYRAIMSLPADKRPRQKPITRAEESGDVILASHPEIRPDIKKSLTHAVLPTDDIPSVRRREYQFLARNKYQLVLPIVAAAAAVAAIFVFVPSLNDLLQRYDPGFGYGSQAAISDMKNGSLFNPACDPTGAHTIGGQHPTAYCNGWTNGYISAWNAQHPGWTNGYIYAWKPYHPPANGSVLSC
jgi:hypothetical protein